MATGDEVVITDDLDVLLAVLPARIRVALQERNVANLLEVILDLGRLPGGSLSRCRRRSG